MQSKPSIVFVHGLWADGSCFGKVMPPLQAEGYVLDVIRKAAHAVQTSPAVQNA